ncbi:pseudouridine synthase [Phycomyces nitens]|nr:pseudouridine synthase [Phycomyces nitens]
MKNRSWKATESKPKWEDKKDDRPPQTGEKEPRLPKKKVAMLIGFNGTGYQGMQSNPDAKSIEGDLFDVLCKVGAVSKDNSNDPAKVQLVRAARTDKGVHAAGNLVSLKLITEDPDLVSKINELLPEQIRVWGYTETSRSFHAKSSCDSRTYEYLLPSYTLMPPHKKDLKDCPGAEDDRKLFVDNSSKVYYVSRSTPEEMEIKDKYRVEKHVFEKFRDSLDIFNGTHNFHNYTVGRGFRDKSSNRHMMNIEASDPMLIEGTEWISVKLHGQSFMLHQIRKMICKYNTMAAMIARSEAPISLITKSFEGERINIPKAPALGLLLERPVYDIYNKKATKANEHDILTKSPEEAKNREYIDFDKYKNEIKDFKEKWIYKKIFETEKTERVFDDYFILLDSTPATDYNYINPEGVIPEECIIVTKHT